MKIGSTLIALAALGAAAAAPGRATANDPVDVAAHTRDEFAFTIRAPLERVAPLFGAEGERAWAGTEWNPVFVHPSAARDTFGMVFTVTHGGMSSTWINTAFDLRAGHVQYVSIIPGAVASLIDIRLHALDARSTRVTVAQERTALAPGANGHVRALGAHAAAAGEEWRSAIEQALAGSR
jgi:hypothetical protein